MATIDDILKEATELEAQLTPMYDLWNQLITELDTAFDQGDIGFPHRPPFSEQDHAQTYLDVFHRIQELEQNLNQLYTRGKSVQMQRAELHESSPALDLRLQALGGVVTKLDRERDDDPIITNGVTSKKSTYAKTIETLQLLANNSLDFIGLNEDYQQLSAAVIKFKQGCFTSVALPDQTYACVHKGQLEEVLPLLQSRYPALAHSFQAFLREYDNVEHQLQDAYSAGIGVLRKKIERLYTVREIRTLEELTAALEDLDFISEQARAGKNIDYSSVKTAVDIVTEPEETHLDTLRNSAKYAHRVYHNQEDIAELYSQWNACLDVIPHQGELFTEYTPSMARKIEEARAVYSNLKRALNSIDLDHYSMAAPFLKTYVIEPNTPRQEDVRFIESLK